MGNTQAGRLEATVFLGGLVLFFVLCLSTLSAFSKMPAPSPSIMESRELWETGCLITMAFLLILALLLWRWS